MGIERATTRWYLLRQTHENVVVSLEAKLAAMQTKAQEPESKERAEVEKELVRTRAMLNALGPCPKAMMG